MTDTTEDLQARSRQLAEELLATARANRAAREAATDADPHARHGKLRQRLDALEARDSQLEAEATTENRQDETTGHGVRRAVLLGLLGAVVTGGLFTGSKHAKAQFGGGGDAIDGLEDLVEIMLEFFELLPAMLIPTEWLNLINQLLSLLDAAGADSFSRYDTIPTALERSFPAEPPYTPNEQNQLSLDRSEASRSRVQSALMRNAAINEQQGSMTMQEQANLVAGQAAGSSGYGVIGLFQAMFANQTLLNQRVGHLSSQISTTNELLAELVMRQSNRDEAAVQVSERYYNGAGDTVAPIRTAPGG